ncbi:MAG TPA: AAA family ATPase, partial [Anaerolineales bacterium]|nr:AAA family ATPase [Anaerolineales bacterium]
DLIQKAAELLNVNSDLIPPAIERLAQDDRVHPDLIPIGEQTREVAEPQSSYTTGSPTPLPPNSPTSAIYLTPLYYGEIGVARRLATLAHTLPSRLSNIPPAFITLDPSLSSEQQTAIKTALTHPVSVLTGGPGTGKTTALKSLISILQSQNKRFSLSAPTGRAAKRLSEATGQPAATIHRMLDYSPTRGFTQNEENPLPIDLLVVDEASMLDLILANSLLKALEPGTHLLLVGDVDQLPSVGAGDVLRDVIASGVAPVTRLSTIFRQAAESYIISNAHRINQGDFPQFPRSPSPQPSPLGERVKTPLSLLGRGAGGEGRVPDFYLFPAEDAASAGDWTVNVVTERIPARFGFDPVRDIQVLAPMYRGPAGVRALNDRLQTVLNPPGPLKPEKSLFGQVFRVGDKVMQTQNDYDKEVFNGDIGQVTAMDALNHTLTINFEGRNIPFDWMECDQITLAYCVSVHKSQGAEFPCVVLPLITAHYMMLQRNLLYTAITRAKQLCVLVGSKKAISMAVRNNKVAERNTALDWRLKQIPPY